MSVYKEIGVNRVVNAAFALTKLGGSALPKEILKAMEEANKNYVSMWELIKKGGEIIAEACGAEAGWITSGAFNALVLSAASCMAGADPEKMRRLPDTTGMKDEIIIQRANRLYVYDRSMEVPGSKFVQVGDEIWGCTPELLEAAINENTAAVHHAVAGSVPNGVLSVEETVKIAHKHGVPVILDVSGMTYPLEGLTKYVKAGVDAACYGGKYVGGPNSTGFVIGKKELIDTIALHSFIGTESGPKEQGGFYRSIGRGYKLDRQEVVALIVAFKMWLEMDHDAERFEPAWKRARYIERRIRKLPGLNSVDMSLYPSSGEGCEYHTLGLSLDFKEKTEKEVHDIVMSLRDEDPEIWVRYWGRGTLFVINCLMLQKGEEKIVVERFKKVFG